MQIDKQKLKKNLDRHSVIRILEACGFDLAGKKPSPDGWVGNLLGPVELGEGERGSFSVNIETGWTTDFGSSAYDGDIFDVVQQTQGLSFPDALEWIRNYTGIPRDAVASERSASSTSATDRPPKRRSTTRRRKPQFREEGGGVVDIAEVEKWSRRLQADDEVARAARDYLTRTRGLDPALLQAARLGLAPNASLFNHPDAEWWLVVPIVRRGDEPVVYAVKAYAFDPDGLDWTRDTEGRKIVRAKGSGLYDVRPTDCRIEGPLLLCEGELDALCALSHGFNALTGSAGASTFKHEWASYIADTHPGDSRLLIVYDGDDAGRKGAKKAASGLHGAGVSVGLVALPDGQDVSEVLLAGGRRALEDCLRRAESYEPEAQSGQPAFGILASDIRPEEVTWIWDRWLPAGELVLLDGDPGLGKSTLVCEIAARVTQGEQLPGSSPQAITGGVILVGAEDSPSHTVRPRLEAAGANLGRILLLGEVPGGEGGQQPFSIPEHVGLLKRSIQDVEARLVVIDPLAAHLSEGVDPHRDADVRRALTALSSVAKDTGVAVLAIRHLNKSGGAKALYRGGGSIGIIGQARVAWLMGQDPADPSRRVIAHAKNNLTLHPRSRAFRLVQPDGFRVARIRWEGVVDLSANDLLEQSDGRGRPPEERKRAEEWLRDQLADGPCRSSDIFRAAETADIAKRTLKRARKNLSITSVKKGDQWWMEMREE